LRSGREVDLPYNELSEPSSRNGNSDAIDYLLSHGVNPAAASKLGEYAVAAAAAFTRRDIVTKLLNAGGSPDAWGKDQYLPLVSAALSSDTDLTAILINAKAKLNNQGDESAWPLRAAVRAGSLQVVQQLLEVGAPAMDRDHAGRTILHNINLTDYSLFKGDTDLRALRPADYDVIKYIGTRGFDCSVLDSAGVSVLGSVLQFKTSAAALVKALLEAGCPASGDAAPRAVAVEDGASLDVLIMHGADVRNPDLLASAFDHIGTALGLAEGLLKAGTVLPADAFSVENALVEASKDGAIGVVTQMLNRGVSPNTTHVAQSFPPQHLPAATKSRDCCLKRARILSQILFKAGQCFTT
jgi:ankyrin repeat protein